MTHKPQNIVVLIVALLLILKIQGFGMVQQPLHLPNNAVLYTYQDKEGFMWFGTYDGLVLYNGKDVVNFRHEHGDPHSLIGNTIYKITPADHESLWISTTLGLSKLSKKTRKVNESYPELSKLSHIESDHEQNTWMYPKDNTLLFYPRNQTETPAYRQITITNSHSELTNINKLLFVGDSICLIRNDGTLLFLFAEQAKIASKVSGHEVKFHHTRIDKVVQYGSDIYFIDADHDLYRYTLSTDKKTYLTNISREIGDDYGFITQIAYHHNSLFISLKNRGVLQMDSSNPKDKKHLFPDIPVFCLWADRYQDILWIGTDGQGVMPYTASPSIIQHFALAQSNITKKPIRTLMTDSLGTLWIGTNGDGLLSIPHFNEKKSQHIDQWEVKKFNKKVGLGLSQIFNLSPSKSSAHFWIGTENGLYYYSYIDQRIRFVRNDTPVKLGKIHAILERNEHELWLATSSYGLVHLEIGQDQQGLYVQEGTNYYLTKGVFNANEIHSIHLDDKGYILVGTRGTHGLARFDPVSKNYDFLAVNSPSNSGPIGDVLTVMQTANNRYYAGSSNGITSFGLRNNQVMEVTHFDKRNGLPNAMIHGILEDKHGYVWFSSSNGIIKYNPEGDIFHNFNNPLDPVLEFSDDAYWACPYTQLLFFGGVNGFVAIQPKSAPSIRRKTSTGFHFFDIKTKQESYPLTTFGDDPNKSIQIPQDFSFFSISFQVLDYLNKDYTFSYRLKGFHDEWLSLGNQNFIDFINLPPGNYHLQIRYKNDVLATSEQMASLMIRKLPPWYRSTLAYMTYTLCLLCLIGYGVWIVRQRSIKKKTQLINALERHKNKEMLETKIQFFTNVTHEFYTPLTLIKGVCEILKEKRPSDDEKYQAFVETMYRNTAELEELIHGLLQIKDQPYEKLQSFKMEKAVDVSLLVEQQLSSFELIAENASLSFSKDIEQNIIWNTDPAAVRVILNNLVSNAFKYTPSYGKITVTLKTQNDLLVLHIQNSGQITAQKDLDNIFLPYHILNNKTKNPYGAWSTSTGLGLSICKEMVQLLGGTIEVSNDPISYTLFTVTLPAREVSQDMRQHSMVQVERKAVSPLPVKEQPTILLVDDNKEITHLLASSFENEQYNLLIAHEVDVAFDLLRTNPISLILTDIMMPDKDGITFIKMLKKDPFFKHTPIIVLSAKVTDQQQSEGVNAGADIYITKPFSISLLKSHIARLIHRNDELKAYYYSPESAYENTTKQLIHLDDKKLITEIVSIIDAHLDHPDLSPSFIAEKLHVSAKTLYRRVKSITGLSLLDFIKDHRFVSAEKLLISTHLSIQEIIYKIGINNKSYFYREFLKRNKVTPKEYRKL